jgi:predicted transcriptional regulator
MIKPDQDLALMILGLLSAGPLAERWIAAKVRRDKNVVHATIQELVWVGKVEKVGRGRGSKVQLREEP